MVEANVKWANGMNTLVYAESYQELYKLLEQEDITDLNCRIITLDKMKQGKEKRKKNG